MTREEIIAAIGEVLHTGIVWSIDKLDDDSFYAALAEDVLDRIDELGYES
jgi:hypothetical protein